MQLVEPAQIQRDHGCEPIALGVQPADDAGAAAERDDCDAPLGALTQDLGDLVLVARHQHGVGRVLFGVRASEQVECRLAARVQQPCRKVVENELGSDDRRQHVAIGGRQQ